MAKLAVHGEIVGTIEGITNAIRYMSDGHILRNTGTGWKLYKQCKPGITPIEAYEKRLAHMDKFRQERPAAAAYAAMIRATCGISKRFKLHSAIQMMPDDPDEVWATVCDTYEYDAIGADLDEIVALCAAYRAAMVEAEQVKQPVEA